MLFGDGKPQIILEKEETNLVLKAIGKQRVTTDGDYMKNDIKIVKSLTGENFIIDKGEGLDYYIVKITFRKLTDDQFLILQEMREGGEVLFCPHTTDEGLGNNRIPMLINLAHL